MAAQRSTLQLSDAAGIRMQLTGFDWDKGNRSKCRKHGVSRSAVESLFRGTMAIMPDPSHSTFEERFKAIGKTAAGRWVFVVFTLRTRHRKTRVRPISARCMHKKEVEHYEKEIATIRER